MILIKKIQEKEFRGEDFKDSYLKAIKYASHLIKDNLIFEYEKAENSNIKLTIYFKYDDSQFASHRCEVCREFKSHFYIDMSPDTNCDACRQKHYRNAIRHELDRLVKIKKENLDLF